jgi:hypothetical protein
LATDVGAIKDCCIDNPDAILVNPTVESISDGIVDFCNGILNNKFIPERQKQFYENNFSYPIMANRWDKCLENPKVFFCEVK